MRGCEAGDIEAVGGQTHDSCTQAATSTSSNGNLLLPPKIELNTNSISPARSSSSHMSHLALGWRCMCTQRPVIYYQLWLPRAIANQEEALGSSEIFTNVCRYRFALQILSNIIVKQFHKLAFRRFSGQLALYHR